jgi:hypothetical protein
MPTQAELYRFLQCAYRRESILQADLEAARDDIALTNQALDALGGNVPAPREDEAAQMSARFAIRDAATTVWQLAKQDESLFLMWQRLDAMCVQITQRHNARHPDLDLIGRAV